MTQPVSLRNALGMFSTVGLGALLPSCMRGGDGVSSAPTTEATVETVEGGTATGPAGPPTPAPAGARNRPTTRPTCAVRRSPTPWHRGVRDDLPRLVPRTDRAHPPNCKVHLDKTTLLTTQLFFDEAVTAEVYAAQPYSAAGRDVDNASDSIVEDSLVQTVSSAENGYLGLITFGIDPA